MSSQVSIKQSAKAVYITRTSGGSFNGVTLINNIRAFIKGTK